MGYLPTVPANFASEAIDGFAVAYPRHVRRIDGGVMRLAPIPTGQVVRVGSAVERGAGLLLCRRCAVLHARSRTTAPPGDRRAHRDRHR